jgi:hypothetical protein
MKKTDIEKSIERSRKELKDGESAIGVHTLESNDYYITITDEHTAQIIAVTNRELYRLYEILHKKYKDSLTDKEEMDICTGYMLSYCCDSPFHGESDICIACGEHTDSQCSDCTLQKLCDNAKIE